MRKLLAVLTSFSVLNSSATILGFAAVGLFRNNIEKEIQNYIEITSLLARGAILSQTPESSSDGRGFSLEYSTKYMQNKEIQDFFDAKNYQFVKDKNVLNLFGSVFSQGTAKNPLTVKNFQNFETNLALANDVNEGKKVDSTFIDNYKLIVGTLSLVFGSDFNEKSSGFLLENVIGAYSSKIGDMLDMDTLKMIVNIIRAKEDNGGDAGGAWIFQELADIMTEEDLDSKSLTEYSFSEVFDVRKTSFYKGLIQLLFSGNEEFLKATKPRDWKDISEKGQWANLIADALFDKDKPEPEVWKINVKVNNVFLQGLAKILKYLRTVIFFIQSLEIAGTNDPPVPDISTIIDSEHLFSNDLTNGQYIFKKLQAKYVNDETVTGTSENPQIIRWIKNEKGGYSQVFNLQHLFVTLQNLFSVNLEKDPNGYALQRIVAGLLQVSVNDSNKADKKIINPVSGIILEPFLLEVINKEVKIPAIIKPAVLSILRVFSVTLASDWPLWEDVPYLGNFNSVVKIINIVKRFVSSPWKEILEELEKEINWEAEKVASGEIGRKDTLFGNPFRQIYSGSLLPKIFKVLGGAVTIPTPIQEIFSSLSKFLTTDISKILQAFNLNLGNDLEMYLFALQNQSLTQIVDSIANEFEIRRYSPLVDSQRYLVNLNSFANLFMTLQKDVEIKFTNEIPEDVGDAFYWKTKNGNGGTTNIINAILMAGRHYTQIDSLKFGEEVWTSASNSKELQPSYLSFLIGNRYNENNQIYFAENSFFKILEDFYKYSLPSSPAERINLFSIRKIIEEASKLGNWINDQSLAGYIKEHFEPYFNSNLWDWSLVESKNLHDPSQKASITYKLTYKNLEQDHLSTYLVVVERPMWDDDSENWFNLGKWEIANINFLNEK